MNWVNWVTWAGCAVVWTVAGLQVLSTRRFRRSFEALRAQAMENLDNARGLLATIEQNDARIKLHDAFARVALSTLASQDEPAQTVQLLREVARQHGLLPPERLQ